MGTVSFHMFAVGSIVVLLIGMLIYIAWYIKLTFFTKNITSKQEDRKEKVGLWLTIIWCIVLFIYYMSIHG